MHSLIEIDPISLTILKYNLYYVKRHLHLKSGGERIECLEITVPSLGDTKAQCDDVSQIHLALRSIINSFVYWSKADGSGLVEELIKLGWKTEDNK